LMLSPRKETLYQELNDGRTILIAHEPLSSGGGSLHTFEDITERKKASAELAEAHKQLVDISLQTGMAEVATGVLHNVGNVLNSVNVSTHMLADYVSRSKVGDVARTAALLRAHEATLGDFVTSNPQGKHLVAYLEGLGQHLVTERQSALAELATLQEKVGHIRDIVVMQQSYAVVGGVREPIQVTDLIEDSLRLSAAALSRHGVEIVRAYEDTPVINVDKHKALQILINLVTNAKCACVDSGKADRCITLRTARAGEWLQISVADNGVGIPQENLTRIFSHGFTTRKDGHGFGLHSGALAARELGGSLRVQSEGAGRGAIFTLELPLQCSHSMDELEVAYA
jgi:signal transduction histidine kinase